MYRDKKLNVVVPMAGAGSRFEKEGYVMPKPLINIDGRPMIEWVVNNLNIDANYIFIVQQSHINNYGVDNILKNLKPECKIFPLNRVTDGAARSVLYTKPYINNDNPLLIVNSDNIIEWNSIKTMSFISKFKGGILTTYGEGPKWSYVRADATGRVLELAEKVQISNHATTGHYYWAHGKDFVSAAEKMIELNIRYNNEFYVAPVYNQAIAVGLEIIISEVDKFWSVGTPEDLLYFCDNCDKSKVIHTNT